MRRRGPDGAVMKTVDVHGIVVSIDRPRGTAIEVTKPDGTTFTLVYRDDYGFIQGVMSDDGASLDAYVGTDAESLRAFIIAQMNEDGSLDELKVCLRYSLPWMAREAFTRHARPGSLGGMGELSVDSLRLQLKAQVGLARPARIVVEQVLEGTLPEQAEEPPPSTAPSPPSVEPAPPSQPAPPSGPLSEPLIMPPKGGIDILSAHRTPMPTSTHAQRFRSIAQALALATLATGGVDADTRAALDAFTREGAEDRRTRAPGSDPLHVRGVVVRAVREESREVDYVASSEAVDSHGEVLRQNWILERFLRNPVILWAHNSDWAVPTLPIGRAINVRVEDKMLLLTVKFSEKNPFARVVFDMILEGMLRAGSVGFMPRKVTREMIGGVERVVCDQNELYEFSVCPMGSNPDALVDAEQRMAAALEKTAGAVESPAAVALQRTIAILEQKSKAPPAPQSPAVAGRESRKMKTKTLTHEQVAELVRRGILSVHCDACDGDMMIDMPAITKMVGDVEQEKIARSGAEERAKAAETARDAAETRAKAAELARTEADTARAKAVEAQAAAEKLAADEKKKAEEAISAKALVELSPLTGPDIWQLSPAAAKRLATRASADPTGYEAEVAEIREKGVKAGALASGVVDNSHLPTQQPSVLPKSAGLDGGGNDADLMAEIERRAAAQRAATNLAAIASNTSS